MSCGLKMLVWGVVGFCAAGAMAETAPLPALDTKQLAAIDSFVSHEMSRQRRSGSARRRHAEIGLGFTLTESGHREKSACKELRHVPHSISIFAPGRPARL